MGCGRTGTFFSFERANIEPDIVILSKSISGYGLPFALVLHKPNLDLWQPAEHNGTFRGNQLAFVTAKAALDHYWSNNSFEPEIKQKENDISTFMKMEIQPLSPLIKIRGLGLIWGIDLSGFDNPDLGSQVIRDCFDSGLIIELAGRNDQVIKLLPPLNIEKELLTEGCSILKRALTNIIQSYANQ